MEIEELIELERDIEALEASLDELYRKEERLKAEIIDEMAMRKTFENVDLKITYLPKRIRETIDIAKVRKDFPEVAGKCRKSIEIGENLIIELKGE